MSSGNDQKHTQSILGGMIKYGQVERMVAPRVKFQPINFCTRECGTICCWERPGTHNEMLGPLNLKFLVFILLTLSGLTSFRKAVVMLIVSFEPRASFHAHLDSSCSRVLNPDPRAQETVQWH